MYYYLKLRGRTKNDFEAMVLSALAQGITKEELPTRLNVTDRHIRRAMSNLKSYGHLSDGGQLLTFVPECDKLPFIYVTNGMLTKLGLSKALYFSYQKYWNHGSISKDSHASRVLKYSDRIIRQYRKEFESRSIIKEGRLDLDKFEKVFKVQKDIQTKYTERARQKMKSDLKAGDIGWIFTTLCKEHGYDRVPPPLKSDIAKVLSIQKTLKDSNSEITVGELIERMIIKWNSLPGQKPNAPSLRMLGYYYPSLCELKVEETVLVPVTKNVEVQKVTKSEDELIDEYISRTLE